MPDPADPVVITGMGAVSPAGLTADDLWAAVSTGRRCPTAARRFPLPAGPRAVGVVPGYEHDPGERSLAVEFGRLAARQALASAGLAPGAVDVAVVSNHGERRIPVGDEPGVVAGTARVVGAVAEVAGARDDMGVYAACAGGALAIATGAQMVASGRARVVLAGGVDALVRDLDFAQFAGLQVLSAWSGPPEEASRPFDRARDGFVLAEGAGLVVLERAAHARRRRTDPLARVLGTGASQSAHSMVTSDPTGAGPAAAMEAALRDAGLAARTVDYLNAHGTATRDNDPAEARAVRTVFGGAAGEVPTSSSKSQLGHTMGAAGALEAIVCVEAIRHHLVPPTSNLVDPDPAAAGLHHVRRPTAHPVRVALTNSFGFGGHNACLVVGAA